MKIGHRQIGSDHPPLVIAEIAQTHDGSLGHAFALAEVARDCGAEAIKFQTHIAQEESTPHEPWRVPFSKQDVTRYDYWRRMEFTLDQWVALKAHCDALGLLFLSSPFSLKSCEWLSALKMPAWKIASGEIANEQLLPHIISTGEPIIVSTGLTTPDPAFALIDRIRAAGNDVALLHCTTRYPTPADQVGLNVMTDFMARMPDLIVGLSDHSGNPTPGIIASYLGASIIEVHFTLHEKAFGPDVPASLTPPRLKDLIDGSRMAWEMRQNPVDKVVQLGGLGKEQKIFGRSLYTMRPVKQGETITEDLIGYKKPGGGLSYEERNAVVGRRSAHDLPADHLLSGNDVI